MRFIRVTTNYTNASNTGLIRFTTNYTNASNTGLYVLLRITLMLRNVAVYSTYTYKIEVHSMIERYNL